MQELQPVDPNNNSLRSKCRALSLKELRTKKIQSQIDDLLDYVYLNNNKGLNQNKRLPSTVGLSASQVGMNLAISIVDLGIGHKAYNDLHTLINPKITWKSKSITKRHEGCVNLPHVMGVVERSNRVKVESYDRSGNKINLDVHGWAAVLMQHEIGHLNGELFIDLLKDPKKAHLVEEGEIQNYKKNKKTWDKFTDVSKLVRS